MKLPMTPLTPLTSPLVQFFFCVFQQAAIWTYNYKLGNKIIVGGKYLIKEQDKVVKRGYVYGQVVRSSAFKL